MSWTDMTQLNQLVAWFDASDIAGSNGDPIGDWPKAGGVTTDLSATGSSRPTLVSSAINSLPAANFDGTDDRMVSGGFLLSQSPFAVAFVSKADVIKNYQGIAAIDDSSVITYPASHFNSFGYSDGSLLAAEGTDYTGTASNARSAASMQVAGTWSISVLCFSSCSALVMRKDGARFRIAQASSGSSSWSQPAEETVYLSVGDLPGLVGSEFDGQVAELIIWSPITLDEFEEVEGYLGHKYAITLDANHPYYASPPTSAPNQTSGGFYNPFRNPVFGG